MEHIAYELAKTVHNQRLEDASRERLARSLRPKRHRQFAWTKRNPIPQLLVKEEPAVRCVPCPSPSG